MDEALVQSIEVLSSTAASPARQEAAAALSARVLGVDLATAAEIRSRWEPGRARARFAASSLVWAAWLEAHGEHVPDLTAWTFKSAQELQRLHLPRTARNMPTTPGPFAVLCGHVLELGPRTPIPSRLPAAILELGRRLDDLDVAKWAGPRSLRTVVDQIADGRRGRRDGDPEWRALEADVLRGLRALPMPSAVGRRGWLHAFAVIPPMRRTLALGRPADPVLREALSEVPVFPRPEVLAAAHARPASTTSGLEDEVAVDECEALLRWFITTAGLTGAAPYVPSPPTPRAAGNCGGHQRYWQAYVELLRTLPHSMCLDAWGNLAAVLVDEIGVLRPDIENSYWTELRRQVATWQLTPADTPRWYRYLHAAFDKHATHGETSDQRPSALFATLAPTLTLGELRAALDAWCRTFDRLQGDDLTWHIEKLLMARPGEVLAHSETRVRLSRMLAHGEPANQAMALRCVLASDNELLAVMTPLLHVNHHGAWWSTGQVQDAVKRAGVRLEREQPQQADLYSLAREFLLAGVAAWESDPRLDGDCVRAAQILTVVDPEAARRVLRRLLASLAMPRVAPLARSWIRRSGRTASLGCCGAVLAQLRASWCVADLGIFASLLHACRSSEENLAETWATLANACEEVLKVATKPDAVFVSGALEVMPAALATRVLMSAFECRQNLFSRLSDAPAIALGRLLHRLELAQAGLLDEIDRRTVGALSPALCTALEERGAQGPEAGVLDAACAAYARRTDALRAAREASVPMTVVGMRGARLAFERGRNAARTATVGLVQGALHDLRTLDDTPEDERDHALRAAVGLQLQEGTESHEEPLDWIEEIARKIVSELPVGTAAGLQRVQRDLREDREGIAVTARTSHMLIILRNLVSNARKHGDGSVQLRYSETAIDVRSPLSPDDPVDRLGAVAWGDLLAGRHVGHVPFDGAGLGTGIIQLAVNRNQKLDIEGDVDEVAGARFLVVRVRWDRRRWLR